jgi:hypothetical protein
MALTKGKRLGGAFLDLKEVAADGPIVMIFRVVEFCDDEPGDFGRIVPVVADVLIVDGPRKGEVHPGEKFIGGITAPLRGVPNPNKAKNIPLLPPENEAGQEIVLRVKVTNPGKGNAGAVGDEPSDSEMAAAEAVYADGAGWKNAPAPGAGEKVGAGAGGGKSDRPW